MKIVHQAGDSRIIIKEVPTPRPGPGEVLIRTRVSALCGSEMPSWRGEGRPGGNLGHEAAGMVAGLGEGVERFSLGQRVGVSAIVGCGECGECREGRYTWCDRFTFHCDMHAEYFRIPERGCHLLPDDVPWETGVLITGDGFGVPYHTSTKLTHPGIHTVAVFGLGPIGLGNVMLQAHLGRRVIGIDRSVARLKLAMKLGASVTINAGDDTGISDRLRCETGGLGPDVAIEAAGAAATARLCFDSVRKGGLVIFNGEQPALKLSPSDDFIRRDITAIGFWFYHFREYPDMLALARGGLPVVDLVTHRYPLADAVEGYRVMQAGESGKVLLVYPE